MRLALLKVDGNFQVVNILGNLTDGFKLCSILGTGFTVIAESKELIVTPGGVELPYFIGQNPGKERVKTI